MMTIRLHCGDEHLSVKHIRFLVLCYLYSLYSAYLLSSHVIAWCLLTPVYLYFHSCSRCHLVLINARGLYYCVAGTRSTYPPYRLTLVSTRPRSNTGWRIIQTPLTSELRVARYYLFRVTFFPILHPLLLFT